MTTSRKNIDKETMRKLRGVLSRLESNGGAVDKSLSFGAQASRRSSSRDGVQARHKLGRESLRQLKKSRDALRQILDGIDDDIYSLEQEAWPLSLHYGIQSLPDDVLQGIFEAGFRWFGATSNIDEELYPVHLSHVNRRFRSVALETPRIWARLSNSLTIEQLKVYIKRSKAASLSDFLDLTSPLDEDNGCQLFEFLNFTIQQSKRWQIFELISGLIVDEKGRTYGYTHPTILDYADGLHLPNLTSLTWHKQDYDGKREDPNLPTFFEDWDLPKLTHFGGLNVVINAPSVGYNLISATLRFGPDPSSEWNLSDTFRALSESTDLKHLTIEFVGIRPHQFEFWRADLESLSSFEITLRSSIDDEVIVNILSDLNMPNLDSIGFTFSGGFELEDGGIERLFRAMMTMIIQCRKLQKLALDFTGYPDPHGWSMITILARKLQLLDEVTLKALKHVELTGFEPFLDYLCEGPLTSPVPWRLLRLRECHRLFYDSICRQVVEDEFWKSSKIDIADDRNVNDKLARRLGDRLIYGS